MPKRKEKKRKEDNGEAATMMTRNRCILPL
jgi:hypothetical protein